MTDPASETQWYIARDGKQHGPLTDAEMRLFVRGGHLKPADLVWRPGFPDWRPASMVFPRSPAQTTDRPKPAVSSASKAPNPANADHTSEPHASPNQAQTSSPAPAKDAAGNAPSPDQKTEHAHIGAKGPGGPTPRDDTPRRTDSLHSRLSRSKPQAPHEPARTGTPNTEPTLNVSAADRNTEAGPGPDAVGSSQSHDDAAAPQDAGLPHVYDEAMAGQAPRRSTALLKVASFLLILGAAGWAGYNNRERLPDISAFLSNSSGTAAPGPAVIRAEGETKTAALSKQPSETANDGPPAPAPAAAPSPQSPPADPMNLPGVAVMMPTEESPQPDPAETQTALAAPAGSQQGLVAKSIDQQFQKSPLWSLLKREFPEWYNTRMSEVADLQTKKSEAEISQHLLREIVALRRQHADQALSASTGKLRDVANAFLLNLQSLAKHSTDTCYTFISKGELSPAVIQLASDDTYGKSIEAQAAAVFEAIAEGRKSGQQHQRASKTDYDALAGQLGAMGWKPADLQLFANPKALAQAPPARVCQMVQDWFSAHMAIKDEAIQERLLFETLRPVVAG